MNRMILIFYEVSFDHVKPRTSLPLFLKRAGQLRAATVMVRY
jgi:hypothetical protein